MLDALTLICRHIYKHLLFDANIEIGYNSDVNAD